MRDRFLDKYILTTARDMARVAGRSIIQANDIRLAMKKGASIRMTKGYKTKASAKIKSENKIVKKMRFGHGRRPRVPRTKISYFPVLDRHHLYSKTKTVPRPRPAIVPKVNLTGVRPGLLYVPRRGKPTRGIQYNKPRPGTIPKAQLSISHIPAVPIPSGPLPPPPPPRMLRDTMKTRSTTMTALTQGQRNYREAKTWARQLRMSRAVPEAWSEPGMKDFK